MTQFRFRTGSVVFCNRAHFVKDGFNKIIYRDSLFQSLKVNYLVYEYLKHILNKISAIDKSND